MEVKPNCSTCGGKGRVHNPEGQIICPWIPCGECWEWDGGVPSKETSEMDTERELIDMRCERNAERTRAESAARELRSVESDYSVLFNQYSELKEANEKLRTELSDLKKQYSIAADMVGASVVREVDLRTENDLLQDLLDLAAMEVNMPISHADTMRLALRVVSIALGSAQKNGRRTDCLECAEKDLQGALRNVEMEDAL